MTHSILLTLLGLFKLLSHWFSILSFKLSPSKLLYTLTMQVSVVYTVIVILVYRVFCVEVVIFVYSILKTWLRNSSNWWTSLNISIFSIMLLNLFLMWYLLSLTNIYEIFLIQSSFVMKRNKHLYISCHHQDWKP